MSSLAIRRGAPANPVSAAVNTAQVFALLSNTALPNTIGAPGKSILEAKRFYVRAEGTALVATSGYTLKASLLANTGAAAPATPFTSTNWTLLGAGTARAIATSDLYAAWWIEAVLQFDSLSGLMQGTFNQMVNNLYDGAAAISNQPSGINGTNLSITQGSTVVAPTDPAIVFAVALTFGTAGANVGNLVNWEVGF